MDNIDKQHEDHDEGLRLAEADKVKKAKLDPLRGVFLQFPGAMKEIARVTEMGAVKYTPYGWTRMTNDEAQPMFQAALGRHLLAGDEYPYNENDIGLDGQPLLHMAQVAWNAMASLEHFLENEANFKCFGASEGPKAPFDYDPLAPHFPNTDENRPEEEAIEQGYRDHTG